MAGSGLSQNTLFTKCPGLYVRRRQNRSLIIEPRSASWIILEGPALDFWRKMPESAHWSELCAIDNPLPEADRLSLLQELFSRFMININGRPYFSGKMWPLERKYPSYLCLHLTEACNFGCRYCMADSVPGKGRMSKETIAKIIEKCLHELPLDHLTIDFHGGEPLLAYDSIKYAVQYAKELNEKEKLGKVLAFMFQTNGSLLTDDKILEIKDLGIIVGVSLDGPRDIHDRNRIFAGGGGTFDTVVKNVKRARELGLRVGLLGVIHNPDDYVRSFRFFTRELDRTSFRLNYSSFIGRSARLLDFPVTRAKAFAEGWLAMVDEALQYSREHQKPLAIQDITNQINNLVTKQRPFMCYRSPCGAGNSVFGFAIDGGIHACEEMASTGALRLGSVYDEGLNLADLIDNNPVVEQLRSRTVDNIPRCRRCPIRRFCYGGCTSKTLACFGDLMRESPMCGFYQIVFEELMWKLWDNPDMVRRLGGSALNHISWRPWKPSGIKNEV